MNVREALYKVGLEYEDKPMRITRPHWNGAFIEFGEELSDVVTFKPFVNSHGWPWHPTVSDFIAADWKVWHES